MNTARMVAIGGASLVFVLMAYAVWDTDAWRQDPAGGNESMEGISDALFDDHVISLEALGILLTAAMIGALIIARPLNASEKEVYPKHGDLAEIQAASLEGATFPLINLEEEE